MQLPYTRFVKQVSNGGSFSRYGYIEMMQRNAAALETAKWHEARCSPDAVSLTVGQITRTDGVANEDSGEWTTKPTYTTWLDDRYDVFAQAGDGVQRAGTMCGYAGCVAYRFTLPTTARSVMQSFTLGVQRDRYLRAGVRISMLASDDASPDGFSWSQIRSGNLVTPSTAAAADIVSVSSWGFLGQPDTPYLLASRATEGKWSLGSPTDGTVSAAIDTSKAYLWVFLTLEDPAAFWEMYNGREMRYYYIEGSAKLVPSLCEFTFAYSETQPPTETWFDANVGISTVRGGVIAEWVSDLDTLGGVALLGGISGMAVSYTSLPNGVAVVDSLMHNSIRSSLMLPSADFGKAASYLPVESFGTFGNLPYTGYTNGIFLLMRNTVSSAPLPGQNAGYGETVRWNDSTHVLEANATFQAFFGFVSAIVPACRRSYSRLRFRASSHSMYCTRCKASINVWLSRSPDCAGAFANVAFGALAKQPAFFTGAKSSLSGSATVTLSGGSPATVSVEAAATLIGSFDVSNFALYSNRPVSGSDTGDEIVLDGLSLSPGDVLIFAPRLDSVADNIDSYNHIHWGVKAQTSNIETTDADGSMGLLPLIYVA
jgi:hypothetical protein